MSQSRDLQGREGGPCGSRSQHESGLAGEPGELLKIPEGSPWVMLGLGTGRRRGREGWLTSIPLRRKSFWTAEGPAGREAGGDQQGKSRNQWGEWVGSGVPQADQNGSYLPPNSTSSMIPNTAVMRICRPNWKLSRVRRAGSGGKLGAGGSEDHG